MSQDKKSEASIAPLQIITPNGATKWTAANLQTIQWLALTEGDIRVSLSLDGGESFPIDLVRGTYNDGIAVVSVPQDAATKRARIKIRVKGTQAEVISPTDFIIQPPLSTISILHPQPGDVWNKGDSYEIQWENSGYVGNVNILLSRNGGNTFTTIASNIENTGSYTWEIPPGSKSKRAKIKIEAVNNTEISCETSGNFRIVNQTGVFILTQPETWMVGSTQQIKWLSSGDLSGNVTIKLSKNNGTTFPIVITNSATSSGTYDWTIPDNAVTAHAVLRISYNDDPNICSHTDSFVIEG